MHHSGFESTPTTRLLLLATIVNSVLASLTQSKHLFPIFVDQDLWSYGQWWRVATWQLVYTNTAEVLVAAFVIYESRVLERLWGVHKFASTLLVLFVYNTFIIPLLYAFILRPLSLGYISYIPSGPTALLFSLLAHYNQSVPSTYHNRIAISPASSSPATSNPTTTSSPDTIATTSSQTTLTLPSKLFYYVLPLQLTLSQFPHTLIPAIVGWMLGSLQRAEVLPGSRWRIPGFGKKGEIPRPGGESGSRQDQSAAISSTSGYGTSRHALAG